MAEIIATEVDQRRRAGVGRMKRHNLRTDMTPLVDLGFLLITFFVFTVQLHKPFNLKLNMPKEGTGTVVGESDALTVLLDDEENIYYYQGGWKDASEKSEIIKTNLSINGGLGKIIRAQQLSLDKADKKEGRAGLMLLIKAGKNASYQMVIDALDEALINNVTKYALLKMEPEELAWLEKQP